MKKESLAALAALSLLPATVIAPQASAAMCSDFSESGSFVTDTSPSTGLSSLSSMSSSSSKPAPSRENLSNKNQRIIKSGPTQIMNLVTGAGSPSRTDTKFDIAGTDLGIAYDDGQGHTYLAFGDTFDCHSEGNGWRSNVLTRTTDKNYGDGLRIEEALGRGGWSTSTEAREFIPSMKSDPKNPDGERTTIPTAGIVVNGVHYIDYMSVRQWKADNPNLDAGWVTNYAATMKSTDGGKTWKVDPSSTRTNEDWGWELNSSIPGGHNYRPGFENLQQSAFLQDGEYVYRYSTPNSRAGSAYLSRVKKEDFPREDAFEYYADGSWVDDPAQATVVLDGKVSELSVAYNDYLGKYVTMYGVEGQGIVMRTANSPEGPWSPRRMLVSEKTTKVIAGAPLNDTYAPYIMPNQDDQHLYYTLTSWRDYNTMLMRTDLDFVGENMENDDHIEVEDIVSQP
ncbi:DUF4185 domain-containing protein [Corynebacterium sp.]|uniref:DUF4185 domain-containing protein n=1 Tax=Corynebacterium sp. TaxID=1720 RepID=UPI0026DDB2BE|nr:DUF4185 domain-containing protein [Corynebacterium sp.]MDO5031792.1 DUF4185 domain-containing protein [Corynebacterium sp.]